MAEIAQTTAAVIDVKNISIDYRIGRSWFSAVRDVDLRINPFQIHGLVGESGSGKSTLGLAMMRFVANNARISAGSIEFEGRDLVPLPYSEVEKVWGSGMALVPQNAMDSLNPSIRISQQMAELTRLHLGIDASAARELAAQALKHVQIADPDRVLDRFPHQLSGGMLQRVLVAMAFSTRPRLVVLDEPTTALDVTTQAVILDLIRNLVKTERSAALYVSHDLGAVAQLCDYVTVLYAGEVMESASVHDLFTSARHPYTAALLSCLPSAARGDDSRLAVIPGVAPSLAERPQGCVFADRCPLVTQQCRDKKPPLEEAGDGRMVRCWRHREIAGGTVDPVQRTRARHRVSDPKERYVMHAVQIAKRFAETRLLDRVLGREPSHVQALRDVSIHVRERSTFGIVGESGSGKTTLARTLVALTRADGGAISVLEKAVSLSLSNRDHDTLKNVRMIFQNPNDSLNPFYSVGDAIVRTIRKLSPEHVDRSAAETHAVALLQSVGLSAEYFHRRPGLLSGGERQRVAIARAFAAHPALVIADEPTSSLDVSVQAVILNLLKDLRTSEGASYVVISHDLEVVAYLADVIAVMYLGEIVEQGSNSEVLSPPYHPYTEALLSAAPVADPTVRRDRIVLAGEIPSPRNRPTGCPFHTRCPRKIGPVCEQTEPPVRTTRSGHEIRCHHEIKTLAELQGGEPS